MLNTKYFSLFVVLLLMEIITLGHFYKPDTKVTKKSAEVTTSEGKVYRVLPIAIEVIEV